jgi:hypothetical protein
MGSKVCTRRETKSHDGAQAPAKSSAQQVFIESQNHCALCNSVLEIQVESYLEDYYLREEAQCPKCNIKTRVKNHKIQ